MKYNAIAFNGRKQEAYSTDKNYSQKIDEFILENENKGFRVIVDALQNGRVIRNAYSTKNQYLLETVRAVITRC